MPSPVRNRVTLPALVEQKDPRLPRFLVVPAHHVDAWQLAGTTVVEATVNGVEIGRRTLKRWGDDRWFIELTRPMCARAAIDTDDRVVLSLWLADPALPAELEALLARNPRARQAWDALGAAQQRALCEEVFAAATPATRARRAARRLGVLEPG
jgi:hypothetical protein